MYTATTKAREERGIFEHFAKDARLPVHAGSLQQPNSPDIQCEIDSLGTVAFELVQLDAASELTRMKDFIGIDLPVDFRSC